MNQFLCLIRLLNGECNEDNFLHVLILNSYQPCVHNKQEQKKDFSHRDSLHSENFKKNTKMSSQLNKKSGTTSWFYINSNLIKHTTICNNYSQIFIIF